jgi:hypothetical protein
MNPAGCAGQAICDWCLQSTVLMKEKVKNKKLLLFWQNIIIHIIRTN